jgi:hypothetical protein
MGAWRRQEGDEPDDHAAVRGRRQAVLGQREAHGVLDEPLERGSVIGPSASLAKRNFSLPVGSITAGPSPGSTIGSSMTTRSHSAGA